MALIKKVAVAGATGAIGPEAVKELLQAGFEVTVLGRASSKPQFSPPVVAKSVDYESVASLTDALEGQDAVVSTLGYPGLIAPQIRLLQAAIDAGVKRFLPSEYSGDIADDATNSLPFFDSKLPVQKVLNEQAALDRITYTNVCTGPFLDLALKNSFLLNVKDKKAVIYDGGNKRASMTRVTTVAKAIAAVLQKPEGTKNRDVYVQEVALTQRELLELAKKATGPDGWEVTESSVAQLLEEGYAERQKPEQEQNIFVSLFNFVKVAIFGEAYDMHFKNLDNELLGIEQMTEEDVQDLIKAIVKR
ncbi:NAD(P)-binding protein [Xylariomycetidae sp. FL0641]|nr:NAD(P)-binding protein [Xylariomycetidae sp. FL0641]